MEQTTDEYQETTGTPMFQNQTETLYFSGGILDVQLQDLILTIMYLYFYFLLFLFFNSLFYY